MLLRRTAVILAAAVASAIVTVAGSVAAGAATMPSATASPAPRTAVPSTASYQFGYRLVASDGGIFSFGNAKFSGSLGGQAISSPIVGLASMPYTAGAYWMVSADGQVYSFGGATNYGSALGVASAPIVAMATTADGDGYWLVDNSGRVYAYGDAKSYGDLPSIGVAAATIVGISSTIDGGGYWITESNGAVYPFGDAQALGDMAGHPLNKPVVGIATTPDGGGYWLVAADGGIFSFGDAHFYGSTGNLVLNKPMVGIVTTPDGGGYWLVAADGGIFSFGDAHFYGSTGNLVLNKPVIGATPSAHFMPTISPTFVPYGSGPSEYALVYPSAVPSSPVVVLVHGGGWGGGSMADPEVPQEAAYLQSQGISVYSIDYNLDISSTGAFPYQVNDVMDAIKFARDTAQYVNGNPNDILLFGGSAGGNLVGLAAEQAGASVQGVIDLSGPNDMVTFAQDVVNHVMPGWGMLYAATAQALACSNLSMCPPSTEQQASPSYNANNDTPRWFLGNGSQDPLVPASQAQELDQALLALPSPPAVTLDIYNTTDHAFQLSMDIDPAIVSFIKGN